MMALSSSSICCCLNNNKNNNSLIITASSLPQFHPSSKTPNRISAHCWQRNKLETDAQQQLVLQDQRRAQPSASTWWRSSTTHCVLGMASMVIILMNGSSTSSEIFMRVNLPANHSIIDHHHVVLLEEPTGAAGAGSATSSKWSDKRVFPPWRLNSLETIVPENLPRPSARRRFESITTRTDNDGRLQGLIVLKAAKPNCFSM